MNIPYVFKVCTKCGEPKVANTNYFNKEKSGKYGLRPSCKDCRRECNKEYRKNNKEQIREHKKEYYKKNKEQIREHKKEYHEKNKKQINERKKEYYEKNKEQIKEYRKEYYKNNKEQIKEYYEKIKEQRKEYNKEYRENNKEHIKELKKEYYEKNKEHIKKHKKEYYSTPQGQVVLFNGNCKRRAMEQNQGDGIDSQQWLEMMRYFDWKCAYSGEPLNKRGRRSIDHVNPLNGGGENEIWNVVPMYKNYNSSKRDKPMLDWYKEQEFYDEERLQKIYEWQKYAYEKWGTA